MTDKRKTYNSSPKPDTDEGLGILASVGIGLLYGIVMHIFSIIMVILYVLKVFIDNPWVDIGAPVWAGIILLFLIIDMIRFFVDAIRCKEAELWVIFVYNLGYWLYYMWLPIVLLVADFLFWLF